MDSFSFCGASYYFGPFFGDPTSLCNYFDFFQFGKFRISKLITSMLPRRSSHSDGVPSSSSSLPGSTSRSLYMGVVLLVKVVFGFLPTFRLLLTLSLINTFH
jgi:hypothetical protein